MMNTNLLNSRKWISRRRVVVFTCFALLVGLIGWIWIPSPNSLQREAEAVGGEYGERDMNLPSRRSWWNWKKVVNAVIQTTIGEKRRSVSIVFYKSGVTDNWVRRNAEEMKKHPIHYLCFRGTEITDGAVADLAGLKSLVTLDLAATSITDRSMPAILKMPQLQLIDLADTDVTAEGIVQVSDHGSRVVLPDDMSLKTTRSRNMSSKSQKSDTSS